MKGILKTHPFPHCCTAKIITDFGESVFAEGGSRNVTYDEIKNYIEDQLKSYYNANLAMFVATTNSEQVTANKVLLDLKFKHSVWMKKRQHPGTKVRLWWKQINHNK